MLSIGFVILQDGSDARQNPFPWPVLTPEEVLSEHSPNVDVTPVRSGDSPDSPEDTRFRIPILQFRDS